VASTLLAEMVGGQAPELPVHEGQELLEGLPVASAPAIEELGDVPHAGKGADCNFPEPSAPFPAP
jgi:hypothetical protein